MWNERFAGDAYYYGTEPNDFLVSQAARWQPGQRVLCLAEGEGRNAVWLARRGLDVTAVDLSDVGLDKTRRLAATHGVNVATVHADLADFDLGQAAWDGIVAIFAHLPSALRARVWPRIAPALRPGGCFVAESYAPGQQLRSTGGPRDVDMLPSADTMTAAFGAVLLTEHLWSGERDVREGQGHTGLALVTQYVGRRPA